MKYFDKIISVYGPKDAVVVKQSSKMHEATSNDWRRCYKEISDETAGRLRAFCQLGTGLNIHLIIADTAENIGALCHVNEPITFGATKGLAIICGGTSKNHQFLTELVPVNHQNDQIDEGAGWVCTPSGERELVLFMDPND